MRTSLLSLAALGAALTLTACGTSVKRMDANEAVDVSGHWNDTDSHLVAQEMISDCLSRPWYTNAQADLGKNPTVIVGTVKNMSSEHIAAATFVENLQRELINSGKVNFVASKEERGEVRDERADQDTHSSEETRKANGQEIGADFMLSGTINSITDQEGGTAVIYFQTNLKLLNMKTHQIAWNGEKKIKKLVSRSRSSF
ncbi:MAG: penicillin-binding protein activator LpoB [Elusimicrobiota bacterium]